MINFVFFVLVFIVNCLYSEDHPPPFPSSLSSENWFGEDTPKTSIVCYTEFFNPKCPWDQVVLVKRALYGRMSINRCMLKNFGYLGCSMDVTRHLDLECSGRQSCLLRVLDDTFPDVPPCHEDLNSYLEVEYLCVQVLLGVGECRLNNQMTYVLDSNQKIFVTSPSFTRWKFHQVCLRPSQQPPAPPPSSLSNFVWIFYSQPGQNILIYLIDFMSSRTSIPEKELIKTSNNPYSFSGGCPRRYGVISENFHPHNNTQSPPPYPDYHLLCSEVPSRSSLQLSSRNNRVKLILDQQNHPTNQTPYLIKIIAEGCPDEDPPRNGWVVRDKQSLLMGCNNSYTTWSLSCVANSWVGSREECLEGIEGNKAEEKEDDLDEFNNKALPNSSLSEDHVHNFVLSLGQLI